MARRSDDGHRRISKSNLLAVVGDDVALWLSFRVSVGGSFDGIPVWPAHDDARAEAVLHQLRSANVIGVRVADDDILDHRWIEPELFQAADDLLLGVVCEQGVNEDDSLTGCQRPGRMDL